MLGMEMLLKSMGISPEAINTSIAQFQDAAKSVVSEMQTIRQTQEQILAKLEAFENERTNRDGNSGGGA